MTKSLPTVTGDIASVEAAHVAWVERASPEERKRLRDLLLEFDTTTASGTAQFCRAVTIEVLTGGISPSLAAAALPWAEAMAATMWSMNQQAGHPDRTGIDVAMVMTEVRAKISGTGPIAPTYTIAGPADVVEAEPAAVSQFAKAAR